nr:MAG TPA: RRN7 Zinc-finger of RNA-polymerase I-specific TFIIB, Rrn7 [Caudoviricetes sp.]
MEETKKCPRCGRELPKSEFFGGYCKECKRAMNENILSARLSCAV